MNVMDQYEKIRTVGKGSFGVAVLYRKLKTNHLVVLKEIIVNGLSPTERQLAQNEVEVLSVLNHPNIISYGGSFEYQGNLMIEMEYADGGTLAQMLANRDSPFPERQILSLIQQICSAMEHMHNHKILHRDLKTANVFLTSEGHIKIGDFGISKVLTTNVQAQTVLGTPYYLSPEMCAGKDYDEKSDIWALGCILYEMCCLHKTFQASSLPALVKKIMKAEYQPIPNGYSNELNILLKDLLSKDPKKRPTAAVILNQIIPDVVSALGDKGYVYVEPQLTYPTVGLGKLTKRTTSGIYERSVVYEVKSFENNINIYPIHSPPRAKIKYMSVGMKHFIVVTEDNFVFTWGNGSKGQLGGATVEISREYPAIVDYLIGKEIIMCSAGDDFSIFLSRHGSLYSCGDGSQGCLGHGDWNDSGIPVLIESLSGVKISAISSGSSHTAVLSEDGRVFTWGGGSKGQTGQNTTDKINLPTLVVLPINTRIVSVFCGGESTMVITSHGNLLVCGCNQYNKLAMERKNLFNFSPPHIIKSLKEVTIFPGKVISCSVGVKHCAILVSLHNKAVLYSTGYPFHKPPVSDNNECYPPERVHDLDDIEITMICCGSTYTVVGTDDNCILVWGIRYGVREVDNSVVSSQESSGVWSQQSSHKKMPMETQSNDSARTLTEMLTTVYLPEIITKPIPLLALYSSPSQAIAGRMLILEGIFPLAHSVFVLVNTTTVLVNSNRLNPHGDVQLQDCDSIGPIPNWMKAEVDQSQYTWVGM